MSTYYVTTAIPYVNADPHVGFALEAVQTDALARFRRLRGSAVRFQTGTDDNSLKSVRAAEAAGEPVDAFVERHAERFRALRGALDLSFDEFVRTSRDPRHAAGVRVLWAACGRAGDLYKDRYRGLYCVGCERFLDDDELEDARCGEHDAAVEEVEEENWFFRLSRYESRIRALVESGELRVVPETRRNEVLGLLRSGLRDFSVSRSAGRARGWGVPVPGDPTQVVSVWFDALANYVTALGFADGADAYGRWWRDNPRRVHVVGKDILRFHAVYWPAILLSAGEPPPTEILTHGFLTAGGRKLSKSSGTPVDPFELVRRHGTDALRWFLLRHVRTTHDADFSEERLVRARDGELADQLGNLVSRVLRMVERYCDGRVPAASPDAALAQVADGLAGRVDAAVDRFALHEAAGAVLAVVEHANRYVVERAPWTLARDPSRRADVDGVLAGLVETIRIVAHHLRPFLPAAAATIDERIGLDPSAATSVRDSRWREPVAGRTVRSGPVLFEKGVSEAS